MTNTHQSRRYKLRFLQSVGTVFFILPIISGCHSVDSNAASVESCGSNTAHGRYYDFRNHSCVVPSKDDFPVLYEYAQISRIARASSEPIDFDVYFASSAVRKADFVRLVDDLGPV